MILSFDTSLAACSAAVIDTGANARVLSAAYSEPGKGHAEILLDMISEVMSGAGVVFKDINRQIVTVGPGSFTGVRVALAAARGFRIAHNIPIASLSTMQAISANKSKLDDIHAPSAVAVIIDARRHQVYGQVFDTDLTPLCAPALIAVAELETWMAPWQETPLTLLGTGAHLVKTNDNTRFQNWHTTSENPLPVAASFGQVFSDLKPDQAPPDPLYLREPDAKPQIIGQARV